jgi:hypothetical protein
MVDCKPFCARLSEHGCRANVILAQSALRKWERGCSWDAITDAEWERWLLCSACEHAGMDNGVASRAWRRVAREALEVLTTIYVEGWRRNAKPQEDAANPALASAA